MKRNRNPRYLKQYRDAAGNWINQYRRNGRLVRLPNGRDFTEAFWKGYHAAEVSILAGEIASPSEKRIRANSIEAALVGFYRSRIFRNLAPNTQRMVRTSLERDVRQIIGGAPLAHLGPKQIKDLLDDKAQTAPAGAKGLFTALRCFTRHCIDAELLAKDPTSGITPPRHRSVGIHTWTEEQVGQFENRWPVGSVPRLAMALHLYTAQRLSDTTRMGWQHVRDGMIHITQQKTGTPVAIPVHPELQRVLDATPRTNLTFLVNTWGRPFTASAYEQRFRKWCNEAGLPQACSSHGLRKAACRRLAEAGCSAYELMAISGHKSLSEAQRYTAASIASVWRGGRSPQSRSKAEHETV